jgi:hypothetical protein
MAPIGARQLWRERVSLGFRGRPSTVRHWVTKRRRDGAGEGKIVAECLSPSWPVPRGYRLAQLLTAGTSRLTAEDELFRTKLLEEEAALASAVA